MFYFLASKKATYQMLGSFWVGEEFSRQNILQIDSKPTVENIVKSEFLYLKVTSLLSFKLSTNHMKF